MIDQSRIAVNASLIDRSLLYSQRLARIVNSGVRAVEFWWPFSMADPVPREVDSFVALLRGYDVDLVAMNLFGGNPQLGERGVVAYPEYWESLEGSVRTACEVAKETGCRMFNVPVGYGSIECPEDVTPGVVSRLAKICQRLEAVGGSVLLEALTDDNNGYPLTSIADCHAVLQALQRDYGLRNCGILLDTFHLANNGADIVNQIRQYGDEIRHVQVADSPGRGAPGSGSIDFPMVFNSLRDVRYEGFISCEFMTVSEDEGLLDWVNHHRI